MTNISALDTVFSDVVKHVIKISDKNSEAVNGATQRRWANFKPDGSTDETPIYSKDYLGPIFNRSRLNKTFTDLHTKAASEAGDLGLSVIAMAQVDILAGWERDLSTRFKSRVRALAHKASEANADGTDYGPLRTTIVRHMKTVLDNSAATVESPSEIPKT